MNLTTRCPACKTAFKVVPDQLKISSGWVRCGRCAEVFDSSANLVPDDALHAIKVKRPNDPPKNLPQPTASPKPNIPTSPQESSHPSISNIARQYAQPHTSTDDDAAKRSKQDENHTAHDVSDLAFVKDANKKAFWQHGTTTRLTILSLVFFTLLLAIQVTYDQRNHFAAKSSGMHRTLTTACDYLNCIIQPDMQIDALKIDSSSLQKIQSTNDGEISELKVSIKNNTSSPIAAPALELSLTDANDRAVLKRVLSVKELSLKEPIIPAMNESQVTVRLLINSSNSLPNEKSQITGYRVLAFYP
jgi:predicted Zn finger-like uncharacterized protein